MCGEIGWRPSGHGRLRDDRRLYFVPLWERKKKRHTAVVFVCHHPCVRDNNGSMGN
jgi:hypothetical protein